MSKKQVQEVVGTWIPNAFRGSHAIEHRRALKAEIQQLDWDGTRFYMRCPSAAWWEDIGFDDAAAQLAAQAGQKLRMLLRPIPTLSKPAPTADSVLSWLKSYAAANSLLLLRTPRLIVRHLLAC